MEAGGIFRCCIASETRIDFCRFVDVILGLRNLALRRAWEVIEEAEDCAAPLKGSLPVEARDWMAVDESGGQSGRDPSRTCGVNKAEGWSGGGSCGENWN